MINLLSYTSTPEWGLGLYCEPYESGLAVTTTDIQLKGNWLVPSLSVKWSSVIPKELIFSQRHDNFMLGFYKLWNPILPAASVVNLVAGVIGNVCGPEPWISCLPLQFSDQLQYKFETIARVWLIIPERYRPTVERPELFSLVGDFFPFVLPVSHETLTLVPGSRAEFSYLEN